MKTLDHIQNPVELTKLAIFNAIFYKAKNNIDDDSFEPVQSIIYKELNEHYDKPIQSFNSDTRLKLLFIHRIQTFNYESAYVQLDALGWKDWRFHNINTTFNQMNLAAWMYFYCHIRLFGIRNKLIDANDHIKTDDFDTQFAIEYGRK